MKSDLIICLDTILSYFQENGKVENNENGKLILSEFIEKRLNGIGIENVIIEIVLRKLEKDEFIEIIGNEWIVTTDGMMFAGYSRKAKDEKIQRMVKISEVIILCLGAGFAFLWYLSELLQLFCRLFC